MKKLLFVVLLMALTMSTAAIDECRNREDGTCVILVYTTNRTTPGQILTGQICNITGYNDSGGICADNIPMTNGSYGPGYHNWTFDYIATGIHSFTISCAVESEYGIGSMIITAVNKTLDTKVDEIVPAIESVNQTCKNQPEDNPTWIFSLFPSKMSFWEWLISLLPFQL